MSVDLDLDALLGEPAALDPEHVAHIVATPKGVDAQAVVSAARLQGTPVTALCGHRWVPTRDPERHPVCEVCLAVMAAIHGDAGSAA